MKFSYKTKSKAVKATLTVALILLLVALNILLPFLSQKGLFYPDLTPESLYSVTDAMYEVCDKITAPVTITFCDEPDKLLGNSAMRYVYILAQKVAKRNENIEVKTVDIEKNPTAVYDYRTTSASQIKKDDVILSCGKRYRIYNVSSFYTVSSDGANGGRYWSFNGEEKLATGLLSVSSVAQPFVYFAYSHGEKYFVEETDTENAHLLAGSDPSVSAFHYLMRDAGLSVGYINLDTDEIPENCVLLVLNGTKEDYVTEDIYAFGEVSPLDKVHTYLSQKKGSVMVFKDPEAGALEELDQFLAQWGITYHNNTLIKDNTAFVGESHETLLATYTTAEDEMSAGVYADLADMASPPRTAVPHSGYLSMAWKHSEQTGSSTSAVNGYFSPFLSSSAGAYAYTLGGALANAKAQSFCLAALSAKVYTDAYTNYNYYSYVFASAGTGLCDNAYVGEASFGNYDVLFSLVRYLSRTDEYAGTELGGTSYNSENMGGKVHLYGDRSEADTPVRDNKGNIVRIYEGLTSTAKWIWSVSLLLLPTLTVGIWGLVKLSGRKRK